VKHFAGSRKPGTLFKMFLAMTIIGDMREWQNEPESLDFEKKLPIRNTFFWN